MDNIIPIEDIEPHQIEDQIFLREKKADFESVKAAYGASNTWHKHKDKADKLRREIEQLKDRVDSYAK